MLNPIHYGGQIATDVRVLFTFDPESGSIVCETHGKVSRARNPRAFERYRAIRYEFLQRVACVVGRICVADLREGHLLDNLHVVDAPQAGRA